MVYRGQVKNGVVILEGEQSLPEGTIVQVETVEAEKPADTLGKRLMKYAGAIDGLPSDLAHNHDHYLYGTPKKP